MPKQKSTSSVAYMRKYSPYLRAVYHGGKALYGAYQRYNAQSGHGHGGTRRRGYRTTALSSSHYDKKTKYTYKRMPKRKRRKYVRFVKKVRHVINKSVGKIQALVNKNQQVTTSANQQDWIGFTIGNPIILPIDGTSVFGYGPSATMCNDIGNIIQQVHGLSDATVMDKNNATYKTMLSSNQVEVTLSNSSLTNHALVDVYTFRCIKDVPGDVVHSWTISAGAITNDLSWNNLMQYFLGNNTGGDNEHTVGGTPFQYTEFCRYFKIVRVQEVQIPAGDVTTVSMRSAKNRFIVTRNQTGLFAKKGQTRGFLFRIRGNPSSTNIIADPVTIAAVATYRTTGSEVTPSVDKWEGNKA